MNFCFVISGSIRTMGTRGRHPTFPPSLRQHGLSGLLLTSSAPVVPIPIISGFNITDLNFFLEILTFQLRQWGTVHVLRRCGPSPVSPRAPHAPNRGDPGLSPGSPRLPTNDAFNHRSRINEVSLQTNGASFSLQRDDTSNGWRRRKRRI